MIGSAFAIGVSGLEVESRTVEAVASNIANMNDTIRPADASTATHQKPGGNPDVYRPVQVARSSLASGGVRGDMVAVNPPHELSNSPSDPNADANGVVARPNVNLETEFVTMTMSRRTFEANLKSLRTADAMMGALLNAKI